VLIYSWKKVRIRKRYDSLKRPLTLPLSRWERGRVRAHHCGKKSLGLQVRPSTCDK
jgi:hypothetical protein